MEFTQPLKRRDYLILHDTYSGAFKRLVARNVEKNPSNFIPKTVRTVANLLDILELYKSDRDSPHGRMNFIDRHMMIKLHVFKDDQFAMRPPAIVTRID